MMNKLLLLLLICFSLRLFSQQDLFIPLNIKPAYEKGTRSFDGNPGAGYWQNSSDYKINVDFNPYTYEILGSEEIIYHNNSQDTLKRIILRLYPNVFKKGSSRDYSISPEGVTDGMKLTRLIVGGKELNLKNNSTYRVINTVATIYLHEYLPPHSSINIEIDWTFYFLPETRLRVGVYDSTTVFIGYWYPQIAVYDDIEGWDYYNYGGQEEFYNDFSNFDVSITVPNDFGVWATGELQNPGEVLSESIYQKYLQAEKSDTVVRIITPYDLNRGSIYNDSKDKNTWHFKAENVTDFAFAVSDHYLWDGVKTVVDSLNNKSVFIQTAYPSDSPDFTDVAEISKNLVIYFSRKMPGVNFPFPSFTAFNNSSFGGGMEFPMMVNNGSNDIYENTVSLTAHEMAHQYFPLYVGTNEKKYAFMDEGWAVMLPFKYMENLTGFNSRLVRNISAYRSIAGTEDDIPQMIPSLSLTYIAYRNSAYDRSSIAYEILRDMLGDELFLKALKEYMKRWNGRHPTPYDFYFTFNNVTGQNLNWFWKPWFFEIGFPDLEIVSIDQEKDGYKILIRKIGNMPVPISCKIYFEDGTEDELYKNASVWKDLNDEYLIEYSSSKTIRELLLSGENIPDINPDNDRIVVH
jgi:hypothetical protein